MNRERYLQEIDAVNAAGKYHPTWESLSTHPVPDWYREKRLGIFLHWGVFSVPAYHAHPCFGNLKNLAVHNFKFLIC